MNIIHGADLKLDWIRTPDQFAALEKFAASFNHKIKLTQWPLVAYRFGNRPWHGYSQMYQGPVAFTAWHTDPAICPPRAMIETMKQISGWAKHQFGGGFAGVPTIGETNFTPDVMQRMGAERCNTELYEFLG